MLISKKIKKVFLLGALFLSVSIVSAQAAQTAETSKDLSVAINHAVLSNQAEVLLNQISNGLNNSNGMPVTSVRLKQTSDTMSLAKLVHKHNENTIFVIGVDGKYLSDALKSSTEYDILLLALKKANKDNLAHVYLAGKQNAQYVNNLVALVAQTGVVLEIGKTPVDRVVHAIHDKVMPSQYINISTVSLRDQSYDHRGLVPDIIGALPNVRFMDLAGNYINLRREGDKLNVYAYTKATGIRTLVKSDSIRNENDDQVMQKIRAIIRPYVVKNDGVEQMEDHHHTKDKK